MPADGAHQNLNSNISVYLRYPVWTRIQFMDTIWANCDAWRKVAFFLHCISPAFFSRSLWDWIIIISDISFADTKITGLLVEESCCVLTVRATFKGHFRDVYTGSTIVFPCNEEFCVFPFCKARYWLDVEDSAQIVHLTPLGISEIILTVVFPYEISHFVSLSFMPDICFSKVSVLAL